jgi:hypothetical protein
MNEPGHDLASEAANEPANEPANHAGGETTQFDPVRGVLLVDDGVLSRLVELVKRDEQSDHNGQPLRLSDEQSAGLSECLVAGRRLHPVVDGIARVVAKPARTIAIERSAGRFAAPLMVAWDSAGRATLGETVDDGRVVLRLTSFDLLPSVLMHELGLLRVLDRGQAGRDGLVVSQKVAEALLAPDSDPDPDSDSDSDPDSEPGSATATPVPGVRCAWRAVGRWAGRSPDTALMAAVSGSGLWQMKPGEDGMVRIDPITTAGLAAKLGTVVTGRTTDRAKNQGTGTPTTESDTDRSDDAGPLGQAHRADRRTG